MVLRWPTYASALVIIICAVSTTSAADIPWQAYHKTSQILDAVKLASTTSSNVARYQDIPDPNHNSDLSLPLVTLTDFKTGEAGKEVLFLVAGEHARELITSEIIYWLYQVLTGKDSDLLAWPAATIFTSKRKQLGLGSGTLQDWVQELLKKVVFKIVPVENIEGRKAAEEGDTCLRSTFSGVDLNRNWATAWKQQEHGAEEYGGSKPFSEPESRIVRLIAESAPLRAFVNIHSGEYALYVPWDSKPEYAPQLTADVQVVLEQLNVWCQCMHGAGGKVAGYLAYGTSMDYMYEELHVPYPLTVEVYGPKGLGKLEMGGHPRRLHQDQDAALALQQAQQRSREARQGSLQQQGAVQQADPQHQQELVKQTVIQLPQKEGLQLKDEQQLEAASRQGSQQEGKHQLGSVDQRGIATQTIPELGKSSEQGSQQQQQQHLSQVHSQQAVPDRGKLQARTDLVSENAPSKKADCFAAFNPPTVEEYQEVVVTWVATILTLADHLAKHPIASRAVQNAEQQQQPLPEKSTSKMDLAKRIGSDEEQQLLRTAKDDLNISSESHSGDHAMESVNVLDTLQEHHLEAKPDYIHPDVKQNTLVYPVVLLLGCVLVLLWRKQTSFKFHWSRRRNPVSRYDV